MKYSCVTHLLAKFSKILTVGDRQTFMHDLDGFYRHFVAFRFQIGTGNLGRPSVRQGPHHGRLAAFVQQADGDRQAFDGVHLDLLKPIPEFVIAFEDAFFHSDITELFHPRHFDHGKFRAIAVAIFNFFQYRRGDI